MSKVMIATGKVAEHPYRIKKIERNIWSIEELCYSLVQSAQFLDLQIMDPELIRWIEEELGLTELGRRLRTYLGKERALSDYVNSILGYVGYISQDKQLRTRQIVASGQGMEPFERRFARAQYLADHGRAYQALSEYEALLRDLPQPERNLRADVLEKTGTIYTRLFRFRTAAEYYLKAYDLSGTNSMFLKYLGAVRMSLSDTEYLDFISEHPECYNASLELEKRVREINSEYAHSELRMEFDRLRQYKSQGAQTNYEIALHRMVQNLKDDYRLSKENETR